MSYRRNMTPKKFANVVACTDLSLVKLVRDEEFANASWGRPEKEVVSPNLVKLIEFSNRFTYWIISEVLRVDNKQRVGLLEYFLEVGEELLLLQDFNGASLVILALRHPSVLRLKSVWNSIGFKHRTIDNKLYNHFLMTLDFPEYSYSSYRKLLQTVVPPFVPFMRLLLEEIAEACTDPEAPTVSTRHYQCSVRNERIYGTNYEETGPVDSNTLVKVSIELMHKSQSGPDYVQSMSFNLQEYLESYDLLTNDQSYKVSQQIEARKAPSNDYSTVFYALGFGLAVGVVIFVVKRNNLLKLF